MNILVKSITPFDLMDEFEDSAIFGIQISRLFVGKYTTLWRKVCNLRDRRQWHCLTTNGASAMDNKSNRGTTIEANNISKQGLQT